MYNVQLFYLGHIVPCLLLAAGAYCASSFELEIKKPR